MNTEIRKKQILRFIPYVDFNKHQRLFLEVGNKCFF